MRIRFKRKIGKNRRHETDKREKKKWEEKRERGRDRKIVGK